MLLICTASAWVPSGPLQLPERCWRWQGSTYAKHIHACICARLTLQAALPPQAAAGAPGKHTRLSQALRPALARPDAPSEPLVLELWGQKLMHNWGPGPPAYQTNQP